MKLYEQSQTAFGLVFNRKLKREHVYLNSYSRMRVNLAAQVYFQSLVHPISWLKYKSVGSQFFCCQCLGLR